jgi:hypothetical protein
LELVCLGGEERSLRLELLEVEDVLQLPPRAEGAQSRARVVGMSQSAGRRKESRPEQSKSSQSGEEVESISRLIARAIKERVEGEKERPH